MLTLFNTLPIAQSNLIYESSLILQFINKINSYQKSQHFSLLSFKHFSCSKNSFHSNFSNAPFLFLNHLTPKFPFLLSNQSTSNFSFCIQIIFCIQISSCSLDNILWISLPALSTKSDIPMNLSHSIPKSLHSDSPFKFQIHILQSSLPILKSFNSKFSLPDPKHFIPNLSSNSQITPCSQTASVTPTIPTVFSNHKSMFTQIFLPVLQTTLFIPTNLWLLPSNQLQSSNSSFHQSITIKSNSSISQFKLQILKKTSDNQSNPNSTQSINSNSSDAISFNHFQFFNHSIQL